MKRILLGLLIFVVAFVGAIMIGPSFVDWNDYKAEISEQIRKATGRELAINGDIEIKILPAPALIVNDVTLNNIKGATESKMIRLKSVNVKVALSPLLKGRIKVETINLVEPQIELEVLADGKANWVFEPDTGNSATIGIAEGQTEKSSVSIAFDSITIEKGIVVYRDQVSGTTEQVRLKQATISASSLSGPFKSEGFITAYGVPFSYILKLGEIVPERATSINLKLEIKPGNANVEVAGTLLNVFTSPRFKGQIASHGENLKELLSAATGNPDLPGPLASTYDIEASLNATQTVVDLTDLTLKFGKSSATGAIEVDLNQNIDFMVKLAAPHIDLDALLATSGASKKASKVETKKEVVATKENLEATLIPTMLNGSIELVSDIITYRDGLIRNVRLNSEINNGGITLNEVSAQLPGGSDFTAFGSATKEDGHPVFTGELESNVNNLRGVLTWLGTDLEQVPSDRLRKVNLTTKIMATDEYLQFSGLDLTFDSSNLKGGVTLALRERPSFGANITLNRINLDSYLPSPTAENKSTPGENPFAALSALNSFDANITAKIKNLVHLGQPIKNISLDATLFDGNLDIRKASVDEFVGSSAQISGKIKGLSGVPSVENLQFKTSSKNIAPLLKFLDVTSPINAKGLGAVTLKGRLDGSLLKPRVDIGFTGANTALNAKGTASLLPIGNMFSGDISVKNNNFPKLLLLLGSDYKPAGKVKTLNLTTALTASYNNNLSLGGIKGQIGPLSFAGDADINLSGSRPAIKITLNTGALDVGTFLPKEQNAALETGLIPAAFNAAFNAAFFNVAPQHNKQNKLLYRTKISNRWSTDPIDISALDAVDLDAVFSAPVVTYEKYLIEKANVSATIKDGVLKTRHLNAVVFGGQFTGGATVTPSVTQGQQNTFTMQAKLNKGRVEDAMASVTGTAGTTGRMDLDLDLATVGLSEAGLVSALGGKGSFAFRDVDVRKGAKGSSFAGFIDLILSLNQLSSSKDADLATVTGTFNVSRGIAQTGDTTLTSGVGNGDASGMVNLPDWTIDMSGVVNAKPNVLTALLAVKSNMSLTRLPFTIKGPLDDPITNIERGDMKGASSPIEGLMQGLGGQIQGLLPSTEQSATQQPAPTDSQSPPPEQPLLQLLAPILQPTTQQAPTQEPTQEQAPTQQDSSGSAPPAQPSSQEQQQPSGQIIDPAKLLNSLFN